jgi:hypothetical protein
MNDNSSTHDSDVDDLINEMAHDCLWAHLKKGNYYHPDGVSKFDGLRLEKSSAIICIDNYTFWFIRVAYMDRITYVIRILRKGEEMFNPIHGNTGEDAAINAAETVELYKKYSTKYDVDPCVEQPILMRGIAEVSRLFHLKERLKKFGYEYRAEDVMHAPALLEPWDKGDKDEIVIGETVLANYDFTVSKFNFHYARMKKDGKVLFTTTGMTAIDAIITLVLEVMKGTESEIIIQLEGLVVLLERLKV